jgi:hypothetical protein
MESQLDLSILSQPDDTTCGPTCLHAIYGYFGDRMELDQVIAEAHSLEPGGGTFAVFLACHALRRGYRARIYTYNLQLFDPTWFGEDVDLAAKLEAQAEVKNSAHTHLVTDGYLEFLRLGGRIVLEDLTPSLIRRYLRRNVPILTGLSSTYLYRAMREIGETNKDDDVRGTPTGHFVVLCGYERDKRLVRVADPWIRNPVSRERYYDINIDRVIGAVLLGVLTHDANLLVIEPSRRTRPEGQPV